MYEPEPPEAFAVQLDDWPEVMEVGEAEQEAVMGGYETETLFEHDTVLEAPPELTVTEALFVPEMEYVFETPEPEPERESVPLQLYV